MNLTEKEWRYFRKLTIRMIIDTDLQRHFKIISKYKELSNAENFDLTDENTKMRTLSIMLKCADIGHGAKTLELHKKWSRRIIEEFYRQGDNEIKHNLPISPLNDRKNSVSKSQEGFLVHIVLPLYEALNIRFKK